MKIFDGQEYEDNEPVHDLGSWECVGYDGDKRMYEGLSTHVDKLPKYDGLGAGSKATCLDTGEIYKYHAKSKAWYKFGAGGEHV